MTVDELHKVLSDNADATLEARECPYMYDVLRHIAEWIHIDQPGFAKSDLALMQIECQALIGTLLRTRYTLDGMEAEAQDDWE